MKVKGGYQIIDLSGYNVEMEQEADSVNATINVDLTDIISQLNNSNGKPIMFIPPSMSMFDVYISFGGGSAVMTTPYKYGVGGYIFDFSFLPAGGGYDLSRKITITPNSITISVLGLP